LILRLRQQPAEPRVWGAVCHRTNSLYKLPIRLIFTPAGTSASFAFLTTTHRSLSIVCITDASTASLPTLFRGVAKISKCQKVKRRCATHCQLARKQQITLADVRLYRLHTLTGSSPGSLQTFPHPPPARFRFVRGGASRAPPPRHFVFVSCPSTGAVVASRTCIAAMSSVREAQRAAGGILSLAARRRSG